MKLSQTLFLVIALHFAVIGVLLVTPGCESGPEEESSATAAVVGPPNYTDPAVANQEGRPASYPYDDVTPAPVESSPDAGRPRFPPTRPTWNVNPQQPTEIIEGTEVEVLEPVDIEPVVQPASKTYIVERGDNLTVIARRNNVSLNDLMAANGLNKNSILQIGQVLVIPGVADYTPPSLPVVESAGSIGVDGTTVTVRSGDTLSGLAKRYDTSISAIRSANGLSGDTIYVGQELLIPAGSGAVASGITGAGGGIQPKPGETIHTVRAGETLGIIARRYGVKVSDLMARNNITDPRRLRVGQTLMITGDAPSGGTKIKTEPGPVPAPQPGPVPAQPEQIEDVDILLENLDEIPAAEVQSTN